MDKESLREIKETIIASALALAYYKPQEKLDEDAVFSFFGHYSAARDVLSSKDGTKSLIENDTEKAKSR